MAKNWSEPCISWRVDDNMRMDNNMRMQKDFFCTKRQAKKTLHKRCWSMGTTRSCIPCVLGLSNYRITNVGPNAALQSQLNHSEHSSRRAGLGLMQPCSLSWIIVSTAHDAPARRKWSELYGREYDQGKVTYNSIYFQQKSLWPIFSSFFFRKWPLFTIFGSH